MDQPYAESTVGWIKRSGSTIFPSSIAMRTNIEIDDQLLKEAMQVSGVRTTKELIDQALHTLIIVKKRKNLTDLAGKIDLHKDFDHKASRKLRTVSEVLAHEIKTYERRHTQ